MSDRRAPVDDLEGDALAVPFRQPLLSVQDHLTNQGQLAGTRGTKAADGGSNPAFAIAALNTTVSSLTWGFGAAWPWSSTTYPTIPPVLWQNLELMPMTPQTEVQETPPVTHRCGDYADSP